MNATIQKLGEIRQDLTQDVTRRTQGLFDLGNKAYLAGMGVVETARQEGVAAYEKAVKTAETQADVLVQRGSKLDHERAVRVESLRADVESRGRTMARRVNGAVDSAVKPVLSVASRLGLPVATRDEVRALNASVAALTAKVDVLVSRLAEMPIVATEPTITVTAMEEGWAVSIEGTDLPLSVHDTKDAAVEQARGIAAERAPSHLVVYKKDGAVQDTVSYHA